MGYTNASFRHKIIWHNKKTFIIYPSMYCSKYRPYQAVEYKLTDRIFRITSVIFQICIMSVWRNMLNYFLYKGRQTRRYFELKLPRLLPFWYFNRFMHVYTFNLLKKRRTTCISGIFNKFSRINPNIANTGIIWMPCETCNTTVSVLPFLYTLTHVKNAKTIIA